MANTVINRLFRFASSPPNQNLVAAWNLSDVMDSVSTNNLTNNGGATFVAGKIGNAVSLDGVDDNLSIADNAALSMGGGVTCSFCGWFKLNALPITNAPIIAKWDTANLEYLIDVTSTGQFRFIVSSDGVASTSVILSASSISINVWYFLVCWYDGITINVELNNNGIIFSTAFVTDIRDGTSDFIIGTRPLSGFLSGLVDAVRIYKRVLTAAERSVLYNNGVGREFSSSSIVLSDEVNRELNQIINLFNGITKDVTPMIIGNDAVNPLVIINQNGAGPIAQFNTTSVKAELLGNGQIKSYVSIGTAPILFDVPSNIKVDNLNVDLLDGLNADDFLLVGAYVVQYTSVFFDGTPVAGDRLFFPTMESASILEGFYIQQRNGGASATATISIAIKKDNDFETLVATVGLSNNTTDTIPISIVPTTSDTDRMIAEVSSISGAVKHSDITITARYRRQPF